MCVIPEIEMKSQISKDDICKHICIVIMNKKEFWLTFGGKVGLTFKGSEWEN